MSKIKVLTMGDLLPGHYIADVDADYPLDTFVPDDAYDPDEQDWQHVIAKTGYVDLPTYTLAYHSGEQYTQRMQATATVWVLCDDAGEPVYQDPRD